MSEDDVREILDRVQAWPPEDQERLARFVNEVEEWRAGDELTDAEWSIVGERALRRELAAPADVEAVFSRYRTA
jgi:hypothetical protein